MLTKSFGVTPFCFLEPGRFYRHSHKQLLLRKKDPNAPLKLKTDEVVIVVAVLVAWVSIIALFIKKWGKIRAIEPCQSYFSPEIYDIPLSKSLSAKRSVDISAQTQISQANTQLILNSGLPLNCATSDMMSRRSLSALVTNLRRDSINYHLTSSSPPSIVEGSSSATSYHQRPRMSSVFVTPPTRPQTPFKDGHRGGHVQYHDDDDGQYHHQHHQQQQQQQQQQQSNQRTSVVSINYNPPSRTSSADSPPRRYKSAEDLRSIVNEFTRRKSTLLMSPSYFMKE